MLYEDQLSKIGIGTWGIGGFTQRDANNHDEKQVEALKYMLEKGLNFGELCYWYSEGRAVELFLEAIRVSKIKNDKLFLIASIYPHRNKTLVEAEKEFEKLFKLSDRNYFDSIQYTLSGLVQWGFEQSLNVLRKYLKEGSVRYVSITNSNLDTLKFYKREFGDKFFSHEVHLSFEIRENEDAGIIKYASENDIINIVYRPLRRNKTALRNWPLLLELSKKYNKTQNQIILNWLVARGFFSLTKSENISHIDEILDSIKFTMEDVDVKRMTEHK